MFPAGSLRPGTVPGSPSLPHHPHVPGEGSRQGQDCPRGSTRPGWSPDRHEAPCQSPPHPPAPPAPRKQPRARGPATGKGSQPLKSHALASVHFPIYCVCWTDTRPAPGAGGSSWPAHGWQLSCREICNMDPKTGILKRTWKRSSLNSGLRVIGVFLGLFHLPRFPC